MSKSDSLKRSVEICLVHGTFAQNAAWTSDSSSLSKMLSDINGVATKIWPLPWTGRNLEKDRWAATDALRSAFDDSDARLKVVIGHSHGGNIAAQALHREPEDSSKDESYALVTLNTPFLNPIRRSAQIVLFHYLALCFGLALFASDLLQDQFKILQSFTWPIFFGLAILMIIFLPLTFSVLYHVPWWLVGKKPPDKPWLNRLGNKKKTDHKTRVLCVATADDEALGWLQFIETVLNFSYLILHRFALPIVLVAIIVGHFTMEFDFSRNAIASGTHTVDLADKEVSGVEVTLYDYLVGPQLSDKLDIKSISSDLWKVWNDEPDSFDTFIIVSMSIISILDYFVRFWAILAILGLFGSHLLRAIAFGTGFGVHSLVATFFIRMCVSPVPMEFRNVEFLEVDSGGWLRHSNAYNDYDVIEEIRQWLSTLLDTD